MAKSLSKPFEERGIKPEEVINYCELFGKGAGMDYFLVKDLIAFDKYLMEVAGTDEIGLVPKLPIAITKDGEADRRRNLFITTYGQQVYEYVRQRLTESRNIAPLMREYYKAVEVLRPYWQVKNMAYEMFGVPQTPYQERKINQFVSKIRKQMRAINPDIAKYYELFYTQ